MRTVVKEAVIPFAITDTEDDRNAKIDGTFGKKGVDYDYLEYVNIPNPQFDIFGKLSLWPNFNDPKLKFDWVMQNLNLAIIIMIWDAFLKLFEQLLKIVGLTLGLASLPFYLFFKLMLDIGAWLAEFPGDIVALIAKLRALLSSVGLPDPLVPGRNAPDLDLPDLIISGIAAFFTALGQKVYEYIKLAIDYLKELAKKLEIDFAFEMPKWPFPVDFSNDTFPIEFDFGPIGKFTIGLPEFSNLKNPGLSILEAIMKILVLIPTAMLLFILKIWEMLVGLIKKILKIDLAFVAPSLPVKIRSIKN